jgi:hypothetical protein
LNRKEEVNREILEAEFDVVLAGAGKVEQYGTAIVELLVQLLLLDFG